MSRAVHAVAASDVTPVALVWSTMCPRHVLAAAVRLVLPASLVVIGAACASGGDSGSDGGSTPPGHFDAPAAADTTLGDAGAADGGGMTIFPGLDGGDAVAGEAGAPDGRARDSTVGGPDGQDGSSGDATVHDAGGSDTSVADAQPHDGGNHDDGGGHDAAGEASHDSAAKESGVDSGPADTGSGACALSHLVISQVQSRGLAGGSDEFVDLYNPTGVAVTLDSTWAVDARSNTSSSFGTRWTGTSKSIPSLGHYLLVGSAYSGAAAGDGSLSSGITDASSVRLTHSGTTVDELCYAYSPATSATLMGAGYSCPGTPATNPHNDATSTDIAESLERLPGGAAGNCVDTGDSSHDFKTTNPSAPENTSSPATP